MMELLQILLISLHTREFQFSDVLTVTQLFLEIGFGAKLQFRVGCWLFSFYLHCIVGKIFWNEKVCLIKPSLIWVLVWDKFYSCHSDSIPIHSDSIPSNSDSIRSHSDSIRSHSDSIRSHSDSIRSHSDSIRSHSCWVPNHSV